MGNDIIVNEADKLLVRILRAASDKTIPFEGMCRLLLTLGFHEHTRGSHHIFTKDGVEEILNLQTKGGKPYQLKQVRRSSSGIAWEAEKMSSKYRYEIVMYWSEEDQAFIAEVPELPGCAADGVSYLEALPMWNGLLTNGSRRPRNWDAPSLNPRGD
jgi:predicted RNA binding protein YcfA (HicA-like mRNA interferase family)